MPNLSLVKNEMPVQEPHIRRRNFEEVALGYTREQALAEAERCLNCKHKPCVGGCPVAIDIPAFIAKIREEDFEGAYQIIARSSSLPAVCGRVCPQETQCESRCVRGIKGEPVAIGRLERFVADWHNAHVAATVERPEQNGHRVAVIGSGPSGLTCAGDLAKKGYDVTVFEALHLAGGVLVYGIPEFRLPKAIVQQEIDTLRALGVRIETNMVIGKVESIDELFARGFEAVFIGSGAGLPRFMNIPGENLKGVYSANEFLTRVNLMKAYREGGDTPILHARRVAVVGGGNVAMDASRTALRLGAKSVKVVYRRRQSDMTALPAEISGAVSEGVELVTLMAPVEILTNAEGAVRAVKVQPQIPGEYRGGRPAPKNAELPPEEIPADGVIVAVGQAIEFGHFQEAGISASKAGTLQADVSGAVAGANGIYAGGDCASGPATVIRAIEAGKTAAANIDEYLGFNSQLPSEVEVPLALSKMRVATGRCNMTDRPASERVNDFDLIEYCMTDEQAHQECSRCLRCDHFGYGSFRGGRKTAW